MNHHAYVLFANSLEESVLPEHLRSASTDIVHVIVPRLSIDEVRSLTALSVQRPFEGDIRVFVIVASDIAIEAQNALLKLFEEPPKHVVFYVVVPPTTFLLPTLRSRLVVLEDSKGGHTRDATAFTSFISSSYAERLNAIVEHTKEKDPVWIEAIVHGCESWAHEHIPKEQELLKALLLVRSYIDFKGASAKMLLEELALSLPYKS